MTAARSVPSGRRIDSDPADRASPRLAATLPVDIVAPSGDDPVDSLLTLLSWRAPGAGTRITYSFAGPESLWAHDYGLELGDWRPLTPEQQEAVRAALAAWARLAPIEFVEVADDADGSGVMRFARTAAAPTAQAHLPNEAEQGGDVWLGLGYFGDRAEISPGTYGFATLIHEIGHALGLKHPHGGGGSGVILPAGQDWIGASIMSYRSAPAEPVTAGYAVEFYPTTPMPLDVLAIRHPCGGRGEVSLSDDRYRFRPGERIVQTIEDAGGIDTLDWSARAATRR